MNIVDLGDEAYRELEKPSDLSIASIVFWFQTNIGTLNNLIGTSYELSSDKQIKTSGGTEIDILAGAIYKQMYRLYRAKNLVLRSLGAASTEAILSVDSDGASVRKINKTTLASEYRQLARDEQENLDKLCNLYKKSKALPVQVAGDDSVEAYTTTVYSDEFKLR